MAWALLSRPRGRGLNMPEQATVKPTLGLTGVTVNAMALIAPGAFLWITYQLQAAATAPDGSSVASDIWAGIGFALILAFLTAFSYAQLARLYPEAGFGSCYYFAEKAFLDRENKAHHKWARLAKLVTGWAAHLFYWVYPGCMVAFMATLLGYIYQQLTGATLSWTSLAIIAALFAALNGYIAMRAVTLSLVIQGLFAYMFEYFAAGFMVSEKLAGADASGAAVTGMAAAAASSAPIGDMAILVGNSVLGGIGFGLMISIAVTVGLAILGTTLSCLNTAVRVSYAMAQDKEMPELLGAMHGRFATPHRAIWVLVVVSTLIAWVGVYSVVGLTGITLASNFGTFVLYGLTCVWTIIAFAGRKEYSVVKHLVVPGLGLIANLAMLGAILYLYIIGNADSQHEAYICFAIAGAWALVSLVYVAVTGRRAGRAVFAAPKHA